MRIFPSRFTEPLRKPFRILNKTFYRFVFMFIAIIGGVLMFILAVGVVVGVQ